MSSKLAFVFAYLVCHAAFAHAETREEIENLYRSPESTFLSATREIRIAEQICIKSGNRSATCVAAALERTKACRKQVLASERNLEKSSAGRNENPLRKSIDESISECVSGEDLR